MTQSKKPDPPTIGLSIVADLWLWGILFLFVPSYFNIVSRWQYVFIVLGFLSLIISFAGALTELGKLWQSEGLTYWGVSLVFLIPSVALFLAVENQRISESFIVASKISALILLAIGGPLFFQGIPYFFWKEGVNDKNNNLTDADIQIKKSQTRKVNLEIIANVFVALLALATAIVTLIDKITP